MQIPKKKSACALQHSGVVRAAASAASLQAKHAGEVLSKPTADNRSEKVAMQCQ
jgi:hypothetical protein